MSYLSSEPYLIGDRLVGKKQRPVFSVVKEQYLPELESLGNSKALRMVYGTRLPGFSYKKI